MELKEIIKKYDSENQFDVLINTYKQIESVWGKDVNLKSLKTGNINSIVLCGLGGSAISGDLLNNYLDGELKIPFQVNRRYNLPAFADKNTLVIISSYSGNTEETLSCFNEALKRECMIAAITSGGEVEKICSAENIPFAKIDSGFQPRFALGLSFFSLLNLFCKMNLIEPEDENVKIIIERWKSKGEEYSKENNFAVNIAEQLIGFIPVIYSADEISAVGYRLKSQFNENSKLHAFNHIFPEMNHNEIIGWESFTDKVLNAKIIKILDDDYHPQVLKRFNIFTEIVRGSVDFIELKSSGKNRKVRIMDLIYLSDWISYYLAVLRGYDPSEIDYIRTMKNSLK